MHSPSIDDYSARVAWNSGVEQRADLTMTQGGDPTEVVVVAVVGKATQEEVKEEGNETTSRVLYTIGLTYGPQR